ncbi:TonB-dependent siderophore receptor [Halomonas cupida]|uniref:TonB-dependent siderophore receptor n=1 Tax=Halomonas TaxID=2745 RepID=UPI001F5D38A7|nr:MULTISPECIES: TonB-dependent siderophore receptor [Halomonas]
MKGNMLLAWVLAGAGGALLATAAQAQDIAEQRAEGRGAEAQGAGGIGADDPGIEDQELDVTRVIGVRLYDMLASEQTGGYSVDAATVGTKVPAALRDIPQSVSVVTHDAIEDQGFVTLDQLAARTPGVRVLSNDYGRSSIFARGYEYDAYSIDGLPAPMSSILGSVPSLTAFDRVEIMRGPSGLFNSTSELGGIVNLVRKRPTETFQAEVFGSLGTLDDGALGVDVAGPIDEAGRVRGRFVARSTENAQWVDDNDNRQDDLYAAVDIDLTDATELSLGIIHNAKDITVNNGQPTDADGDLLYTRRSAFYGADWNDFDSESTDVLAELTHRFANDGYGRVAARYSDRDADYNYAFGAGAVDDQGRLNAAGFGGKTDETSLSLDASYTQAFDAFGNDNEFVVGLDHKDYDQDNRQGRARGLGSSLSVGQLNDLAYVNVLDSAQAGLSGFSLTDTRSELEETGAYAKVTVRPIAPLALIAGGRFSHFSTEYDDRTSDSESSRSDSEFTPYAGAVLDLDAQHSLYASYSRVFKPQTAFNEDNDLIDPREGDQYEVGIKGSYLGGRLNARASAYQLEDSHRAAASSDPGASYSVDTGEVRIRGAELEVTGSLTDQWDLIFGYTYTDTEIEKASSARDDGIFLLMPENMVNLWSQYRFQQGMLNGLSLGGGITAMSDFSSSSGVEAPGYAVVDAMLGYEFTPQLSGQLNVYNLFDREYYLRAGGEGSFNFVGQPASALATLRYAF